MQTSKVSGVKTSIRFEDGMTHVKYHSTDVVSFDASRIILRSGGWQTVTTKRRINQANNQFALGVQVYQKRFYWYVVTKAGTFGFVDGMVIDRNNGFPQPAKN